ncbi:MAG: hypothetical protein NT007_07500 [Candidatus Kapabacteria bacterium]|nr:hypothetical protein [Candidatus Kapabacteria bacterium]
MNLTYENKKYNVESKIEENILKSQINGESKSFNIRKINDNTIAILSDGKYSNAYFAEDSNNLFVNYQGYNYVFTKTKEEEKSYDTSDADSSDILLVKAPMPGCVVKVEVESGAAVEEGSALLIVEAMKMETCIFSTISGIVTEINVKAGEQVDPDKILLKVEKVKTE